VFEYRMLPSFQFQISLSGAAFLLQAIIMLHNSIRSKLSKAISMCCWLYPQLHRWEYLKRRLWISACNLLVEFWDIPSLRVLCCLLHVSCISWLVFCRTMRASLIQLLLK
jgi:hypothetical protein